MLCVRLGRKSITTPLFALVIICFWTTTHAHTYWSWFRIASWACEIDGQRGTLIFRIFKDNTIERFISAGRLDSELSAEDVFWSSAYSPSSVKLDSAGFGLIWQPYSRPEKPNMVLGVKVPIWLILVLLVLPTYLRWRQRRVRRARGLCENCGYDLRASTGVCPECGVLAVPGGAPKVE